MRITEVFLFQCKGADLYAFSVDRAGLNLPKWACNAGWELRGQLSPADLVDSQYADAITAISEQGFSILNNLPSRKADSSPL